MRAVERLDLPAFLDVLRRERRPNFLVHGPPLSGKSTFARRLAQRPGVQYLDLLAHFHARPELAARLDEVDALALEAHLREHVRDEPPRVLLVDELDFLLYAWARDLDPFRELVDRLTAPSGRTVFGFFIQTNRGVDAWHLPASGSRDRVLRLEDLAPLSAE